MTPEQRETLELLVFERESRKFHGLGDRVINARELDALRAALAPPPTCGTWQPIETAPKDGTDVLLWEPAANLRHDGLALVGAYVDFKGAVVPCGYHDGWFDNASGRYEITPTHWMPLPTTPTETPR